ncbi:hypothetical protein AJ80_04085 [Polytolypa hystricis UAMH7299]|uniref:Rhodopsin domain-containing protein n=1 Tax=Polytolypa hystricis (strain UAMH7299) TaxID=1447883 RepID=A0A2B7YDF3_POLH7|nr:hypothetical protein AJ80_04085 [Polytolypa hystricis UAMH7299]
MPPAAAEIYYPVLGFVRAELIVNCVVVFSVLTVVTLRVIGRIIGPGLGWDDYLIIFAAPLGVAMLVCQGLFAPVGNGYSLIDHPELEANIPFILQLTFGMQVIYVVLLSSVKASVLCFYLRVFITPFVQRAAKITLGFMVAWLLSFVFACIFICTPVEAQWTGVGKCGQYIPLIQSLIATNALGDLVIMVLPMHSIWSLQMRKTDKIGITSCFALGIACIVCAVFRLFYISSVDLTGNVTGTMPTTVFLFILEPNLAILCVSIPMLRPFYSKYKSRVGGSRLEESSGDRPSRYIISKNASQVGKSRTGFEATEALATTWEMDDYYGRDGTSHHAAVASYGDDSRSAQGSADSLQKSNAGGIGVETKWSVSRS